MHVVAIKVMYDFGLGSIARHPGSGRRSKITPDIWGGISCRDATALCIFEGIMDKCLYTEILEKTLLPFIHEVYPFGHHFMQDNDP